MSALFFVVGFGALLAYHVHHENMPLWVGALLYCLFLFSISIGWIAEVVIRYRVRKRANEDAFIAAVVAAHQRANEARQATERA